MKYFVTAFSELEAIEVLNVTHSLQEYPAHYHDCFCFSVVSEGVFIEDGRLISYDKLLITNPMQVHENQTYGGLAHSLTTLYINQDIVNYAFGVKDNVKLDTSVDNPVVVSLFHRLAHQIIDNRPSVSEQRIIEVLRTLKPYSVSCLSEIEAKPDWVVDSYSYIEQHAEQSITVETLAIRACMDKYKFIRQFKQNLGMTPTQFLILQRVIRAKNNIKAGATLLDASLDSGFYDQSDLTRYFKRYVGITPKKFQQAFLQYSPRK